MSAAFADPMESEEFATLLAESAAETPTPAPEPEQEPDTPEAEATPTEGEPSAPTSAEPAKAEPAPAPAQPSEPKTQWQIDLETAQADRDRFKRESDTLRGQVSNAATQAANQARQQALDEFRQNQRGELVNSLQAMVNKGEVTLDAAQAHLAGKDAEWAQQASQQRETEYAAREANTSIGGVALQMDHATVRLHQAGIPSLAQQAGLPEEYARQFFDGPEVERYQRAIGQAEMAKLTSQRGGAAGFNARADADYLNTVYQGMRLAGTIHQALSTQHTTALAAKDREIADLKLQLNRDESPDAPPERPARAGGRKVQTPGEHATQVLTEHSDILAAWLG